jgi:predicted transcriptional regulator
VPRDTSKIKQHKTDGDLVLRFRHPQGSDELSKPNDHRRRRAGPPFCFRAIHPVPTITMATASLIHALPKTHPKALRLTLLPSDVLPEGLTWRIHDGYTRTTTWDSEGESITLGIWGPGDLVTNAHSGLDPVEVHCLTTVVVEQHNPSDAETLAFLLQQIRNTEEIFEINRIRSAERRLLMLLRWLGLRFGQVSSRGYRFSLKDMNLTHRALAEVCGLTRVTVTKNLNRYKTLGLLQKVSEADLFIPSDGLAAAI